MVPSQHLIPLNESLPPSKRMRITEPREAFSSLDSTFTYRISELIKLISLNNLAISKSNMEFNQLVQRLELSARNRVELENKTEKQMKTLLELASNALTDELKVKKKPFNPPPEGMYL